MQMHRGKKSVKMEREIHMCVDILAAIAASSRSGVNGVSARMFLNGRVDTTSRCFFEARNGKVLCLRCSLKRRGPLSQN